MAKATTPNNDQSKVVSSIKKTLEEIKKLQDNLTEGDTVQLEIIKEKEQKLKGPRGRKTKQANTHT